MGTKAKKGDFRETERERERKTESEGGGGGCKDTEEETGKQQREKSRAYIKSTEGNTGAVSRHYSNLLSLSSMSKSSLFLKMKIIQILFYHNNIIE